MNKPTAGRRDAFPDNYLLHDDALEFLQTRTARLERLETRRESAVFRRLADFGGAGAVGPRAPKMMVATLQLEVAQRLMAQADDDDYGMLTLLVQLDFGRATVSRFRRNVFSRAGRGFRVRDVWSAARQPLLPENLRARFCENREARVFATAQDDVEAVETGLAGGKIGGRVCGIKNLAAGTRGEIELGTVCGVDEKSF